MKNGQTPTPDVVRSLVARAFHRRIGLGVGVTIVVLVIIAIVVFYVTRGQGAGDTPSVDGAFTDWLPQMWCSPENLSQTCKDSKPVGAKYGWQNKIVAESAVQLCPNRPTTDNGQYPKNLPSSVSSWLLGVDNGTAKCNLQSSYLTWLQAYRDTIASTPKHWPKNDPAFYKDDESQPAEYMTGKYPPACPPLTNCYKVNTEWGQKGGGQCPKPPGNNCIETQPRFNWIIGTCIGNGCAQYGSGNSSTKQFKNMGSRCVVNYIAAYNFDVKDSQWKIARDSSFNTDGRHKPYDCLKAFGGLDPNSSKIEDQPWLIPQPLLAANYINGYFPHDAEGLGVLATQKSTPGLSANGNSGAFMVVLSLEDSFNQAFFTLNQNALTRLNGYGGWDNCWANANGGENEMMESPFSVSNAGDQQEYARVFPNNFNNVGRAYQRLDQPDDAGVGGFYYNYQWTGGLTTSSPLTQPSDTPFVFAFIFDGVAQWNYRIPASSLDDGKLWSGLRRRTAGAVLSARPSKPPTAPVNTCMSGKDDYCMSCLPNCPFMDKATAGKAGCSTAGWCGNWLGLMKNTRQWQYKSNGSWEIPTEDGKISEAIWIATNPTGGANCWNMPFPDIDPSIIKIGEKTWRYVCDDPTRDGCSECQEFPLNKSMFCPRMIASTVTQPWGNKNGPADHKQIGYVRACADIDNANYSSRCYDYR